MVLQKKYSDILADILKKKYSKCICPTEYLSDLSYKRPSSGASCHFGPNCQFTATCKYDESRCTCNGKCTCGPQSQSLPPPTARTGQHGACTQQNCTCEGICLCQSDESLLSKSISRAPRDCNKAVCTCTVCLCQPDQSSTNYLPTYFRNTVKREVNALMSDEMMKKECQEIKQLLVEHEVETRKKTMDKSKQESSSDTQKSLKRLNSAVKEVPPLSTRSHSNSLEGDKKLSFPQMVENKKNPSTVEGLRKSILKSNTASRDTKRQSTKKEKKILRKEKLPKKKHSIIPPSTAKTRFTATYCGCRSTIKKPFRMRYALIWNYLLTVHRNQAIV